MSPADDPRPVPLSAEAPTRGAEVSEVEEFSLRPRHAGEIVDLGMEVLARRFLPCIGIAALLWFPVRAGMSLLMYLMPTTSDGDPTAGMAFFGGMLGIGLLSGLIQIVATMAVTLVGFHALIGNDLSALEALRSTLRRTPALVGLALLNGLILTSGAGLLGVVGMFCPPLLLGAVAYYAYFSWKLSLAPSILILEKKGVGATITRSFKLTEGSFLRWLGISVLGLLLASWFQAGMGISDNYMLREEILRGLSIPAPLFDAILIPISTVFSAVSTAILAVIWTAYYLDTRIRREGLDLRMRLLRRSGSAGTAT